jgi:hypothetical protein
MDYMELVKRSISNAWNYRFLWLFGFFVSVTDGFGGGHWWMNKLDRSGYYDRFGDFGAFRIDPAFLVLLAMAAFSLWVIFWVMSVISEGSLIHGVSKKEFNLKVGFADCWSAGLGRFLRLLGIMMLALMVVLAVVFGLILIIVPSYFASIALGIVLTIFALPVLLAAIIVTISVEGWAIRFAVLNDEPWLAAIGKGWQLFINNIGRTLAVAFLSFFAQLILWCLLIIGVVMLAIPFVIVGIFNPWLGLVPGLFLGLIIIVLSSAFFGTFASSMWTLGFMRMTGYADQQNAQVTSF